MAIGLRFGASAVHVGLVALMAAPAAASTRLSVAGVVKPALRLIDAGQPLAEEMKVLVFVNGSRHPEACRKPTVPAARGDLCQAPVVNEVRTVRVELHVRAGVKFVKNFPRVQAAGPHFRVNLGTVDLRRAAPVTVVQRPKARTNPSKRLAAAKITYSLTPAEMMYVDEFRFGLRGPYRYSLALRVEARFESDDLSQAPYLEALTPLEATLLGAAAGEANVDAQPIKTSTPPVGTSVHYRVWIVYVKLKTAPRGKLAVRMRAGPRTWHVALAPPSSRVPPKLPGQTAGAPAGARFDVARARVKLQDPDWLVVQRARFMEARDGSSALLEVVVENRSGTARSLGELMLFGSHRTGSSCVCHDNCVPEPWQDVSLNLTALAGNAPPNKPTSWTRLRGQDVRIVPRLSLGSCSAPHRFSVWIPIQKDIPGGSFGRIQLRFDHRMAVGRVGESGRDLPTSVVHWDDLRVQLSPSHNVFPFVTKVAKPRGRSSTE